MIQILQRLAVLLSLACVGHFNSKFSFKLAKSWELKRNSSTFWEMCLFDEKINTDINYWY